MGIKSSKKDDVPDEKDVLEEVKNKKTEYSTHQVERSSNNVTAWEKEYRSYGRYTWQQKDGSASDSLVRNRLKRNIPDVTKDVESTIKKKKYVLEETDLKKTIVPTPREENTTSGAASATPTATQKTATVLEVTSSGAARTTPTATRKTTTVLEATSSAAARTTPTATQKTTTVLEATSSGAARTTPSATQKTPTILEVTSSGAAIATSPATRKAATVLEATSPGVARVTPTATQKTATAVETTSLLAKPREKENIYSTNETISVGETCREKERKNSKSNSCSGKSIKRKSTTSDLTSEVNENFSKRASLKEPSSEKLIVKLPLLTKRVWGPKKGSVQKQVPTEASKQSTVTKENSTDPKRNQQQMCNNGEQKKTNNDSDTLTKNNSSVNETKAISLIQTTIKVPDAGGQKRETVTLKIPQFLCRNKPLISKSDSDKNGSLSSKNGNAVGNKVQTPSADDSALAKARKDGFSNSSKEFNGKCQTSSLSREKSKSPDVTTNKATSDDVENKETRQEVQTCRKQSAAIVPAVRRKLIPLTELIKPNGPHSLPKPTWVHMKTRMLFAEKEACGDPRCSFFTARSHLHCLECNKAFVSSKELRNHIEKHGMFFKKPT